MGSAVELNAGVAKFKIDLNDFANAMKRLVGAAIGVNEKEHAREAMKMLLAEATITFKVVVQTLAPLCAVKDESAFMNKFASVHEDFKKLYMERKKLAHTHCTIVEREFNKLQQRRSWMASVPLAQKAYLDLEQVCGRWLFQDRKIVADMELFLESIDKFIQEIATLNRAQSKEGFRSFVAGWQPIESDFFAMQTQLGELEALQRQI